MVNVNEFLTCAVSVKYGLYYKKIINEKQLKSTNN